MTSENILRDLTGIFRDVLDDDNIILTPQMTAQDVTGWDSANHINIVVSAEMRFKIKVSNAEIERLENVGDFVELIQRKLSAKK